MSVNQNIEIVRRAIEGFRTEGVDGFVSFFSENAVNYVPGNAQPLRGREAIRKDNEGFAEIFSEMSYENVQLFGSDDRVCAQGVLVATHTGAMSFGPENTYPATNKQIRVPVCDVMRIEDGEIVESHEYFDRQEFMSQLGES